MNLREIFHGRERPFDQVPMTSEYLRSQSRVKTIAVVVGIAASIVTAIGGAVLLPDKMATSAAKGLQTKLDERYLTVDAHREFIAAEQKSRDEMEKRLDIKLDALSDRLGDTNAMVRALIPKINESVAHGQFATKVFKGELVPPYEPLPRKAPTK